MRYGIPGFRTPREMLDGEIQRIVDLGVETRMKTRIGSDVSFEQIWKKNSTPSSWPWAPRRPSAAGSRRRSAQLRDRHGVPRAFNEGRLQHVGNRVVVIGGGDTSIDVATVARRLGNITNP